MFLRKRFSHRFRTLSDVISIFCQTVFREAFKSAIFGYRWSFRGIYFFWKKHIFCSFSDTARTFLGFVEEFFVAIMETAFDVSIGSFWEKNFLRKKITILLTLSDIDRKGWILSSKFYEKVFKAALFVSTETFLVEMLLENFFLYFFRHWATFFRLLSILFRQGLENCILRKYPSADSNDFLKTVFANFGHWEYFSNFLTKSLRSVCQNCFLRVHRTNFGETNY